MNFKVLAFLVWKIHRKQVAEKVKAFFRSNIESYYWYKFQVHTMFGSRELGGSTVNLLYPFVYEEEQDEDEKKVR